jgi:hypothetical protein
MPRHNRTFGYIQGKNKSISRHGAKPKNIEKQCCGFNGGRCSILPSGLPFAICHRLLAIREAIPQPFKRSSKNLGIVGGSSQHQ